MSNLFPASQNNILPCNGEAYYFSEWLNPELADACYRQLLQDIQWQNDTVKLYGKTIITRRKTAWYGDDTASYTYSGIKRTPLPWTKELQELRALAEQACSSEFNACLLNFYHDGADGMSWHSDDEKELGKQPVIASLSLGAERRFLFRHKLSGIKTELLLGNGSLLLMKGECQQYWKHSLPKSVRIHQGRINLTFRKILF